jgi:NAD+ diphosphatase
VERHPLVNVNFSRDLHDRLTAHRSDPEYERLAWADPETRVIVADDRGRLSVDEDGSSSGVDGSAGAPVRRRLATIPPAEAPDGERVLLGRANGHVHYLVLPPEGGLGDRPFCSLRELFADLDDWEASLAVHAVGLANWHRAHPHCARCGSATVPVVGGESRTCASCGATHFPRTDPAVIMLVVDDRDRILLGHNGQRPDGWFSALAGFVEPGESLEAAVRREVYEEVGLVVDDVAYVGSQPWPFPSSLMLGFFAHTTDPRHRVDGEEITEARWFTRRGLKDAADSGAVLLPGGVSIARRLVEDWYGGDLPGSWP